MRIAKLLTLLLLVGFFAASCTTSPTVVGEVATASCDAIPVAPTTIEIKEIVYFDFDKRVVRDDSRPILDKVAAYLKKYPDTKLLLKGHTDKWGPAEYNVTLSKDRAEHVKAELVKLGVPADQIETKWVGKTDLISKIHKENRRVVILSVE